MLEALESSNELLFVILQFLGFTLVLVNQLLLVVDLVATFCTRCRQFLLGKGLHRILALSNHLADRLTLHSFCVEVLSIVLLFSHEVVFQLAFDGLSPLHLGHIHVVAGVLHILAAHLLALKSLLSSHALLLFLVLGLHLLLSNTSTKRHHHLQQDHGA